MASQDGENNDTNSILIAPEPIKKSGSFSAGSSNIIKSKRKWDIERTNLLNIGKICIKTLIDESMTVGSGRVLTEEFSTLEQFFIVLEHILRHGLKGISDYFNLQFYIQSLCCCYEILNRIDLRQYYFLLSKFRYCITLPC